MPATSRGKLFPRLLLLFTVVPIVELVLLVWLGGQIGFWPTVALIVLTAFVGTWLAQREGLSVWRRFQTRLATGEMPGKELSDGMIILVSAAFLLTPGVLTDVVGLLGLFPPTRALLRREVLRRAKRGVQEGSVRMFTFGAMPTGFGSADPQSTSFEPPAEPRRRDEDVIDVEFEEIERPPRDR